MEKSSNYHQQLDDTTAESTEWEAETDFEDNSIPARKERQNSHGRDKGTIRRDIEEFKEQQRLKAFLGDDLYD